jgi:8-oxo-dGTP pyrophosphatase MutT (NUDIX family)
MTPSCRFRNHTVMGFFHTGFGALSFSTCFAQQHPIRPLTVASCTLSASETNKSQFTLAGGYLIRASHATDIERKSKLNTKWEMTTLPAGIPSADEAQIADHYLKNAESVRADGSWCLECDILGQTSPYHIFVNEKFAESTQGYDQNLQQLLFRMLLLWTIHIWSSVVSDCLGSDSKFTIHSQSLSMSNLILTQSDCQQQSDATIAPALAAMYRLLLPPSLSEQNIMQMEWVEMVDRHGVPLCLVPRILVHQFNLLHRGIGIIVASPPMYNTNFSPLCIPDSMLYVHRRSPTKKVFPNLYDMFVGGVSLPMESPRTTAIREISEELSLHRGSIALSTLPWFTCVVCTNYNRCVVSVFAYQVDAALESVRLQDDEISWGSFVPYSVVEGAAEKSIQRLVNNDEWPGNKSQIHITHHRNIARNKERKELQWDFVPDGLLVWECWLNFITNYS